MLEKILRHKNYKQKNKTNIYYQINHRQKVTPIASCGESTVLFQLFQWGIKVLHTTFDRLTKRCLKCVLSPIHDCFICCFARIDWTRVAWLQVLWILSKSHSNEKWSPQYSKILCLKNFPKLKYYKISSSWHLISRRKDLLKPPASVSREGINATLIGQAGNQFIM